MNKFITTTKKLGAMSAFLAITLSHAAFADVTDTIERTISFDHDGRIQLSNINGNVTINACNCSEVTLLAEIEASSQEVRERILVEIDESQSELRIRTKYKKRGDRPSWNNERSQVTYTLSVPNQVRLDDIELVNGDLTIRGVSGELVADLVNGELESDGGTSSTRVNMVNGDMTIKFDDLNQAKHVDLDSVNGRIDLYLPANSNATINAETVSGRISNDFGIEVIKHKYVGSDMRGTIGNGDVRINLENVNGKIAVNRL